MRKTKIIVIVALIVIYLITDNPQDYGYSKNGELWQHFTYPFFHASLIHLSINLYALYNIFNYAIIKPIYLIILIYAISVVSSFICPQELPTIGISAMLFSLSAIYVSHCLTLKNIALSLLALSLSLICTGVNPYIHLFSWLFGFIFGFALKFINRVKRSYIDKQ